MQAKKKYIKPVIRKLIIDERITLVMNSTSPPPPPPPVAPPGGGSGQSSSSDRPFHNGPFDNNTE